MSGNPFELDFLTVEKARANVWLLTLDRPQARNAFNTGMALEIIEVFDAISLEPGRVRAVVVTGRGNRAFCAGADLKERHGMDDAQWRAQHLVFERMIRSVLDCPIPIIGAVNGAAYAGGCELALGLDFLYASENAVFAQTETRIGIIPGAGGTQTLARAVGERRAKELIMSAKPFSAAQALDWGLVNAVCSQDQLLGQALDAASEIAANAPIAVRQAKQAIHRGLQMSLGDGMAFEIEAYNRTVSTKDRIEGVRAFNEKRTPQFEGS